MLTEFDQELHDRCTYEDGVAEGAQRNAIANAKSMLRDSVAAEQVAKWTSLPLEQVLALKSELE